MVTVISPDFQTIAQWDKMSDWLIENFGPPGQRWDYDSDVKQMRIKFTDSQDAAVYVLRWSAQSHG
jgi:hypothetical protein